MSFGPGSNRSQHSHTCCDTTPLFGKVIPRLNFFFSFRVGGGGEGLDGRKENLLIHHRRTIYYHPSSFDIPSLNCAEVHLVVDVDDGSEGSGDCGL